jgi:photosystem II stability/assembly factor-like uncharacterized protein
VVAGSIPAAPTKRIALPAGRVGPLPAHLLQSVRTAEVSAPYVTRMNRSGIFRCLSALSGVIVSIGASTADAAVNRWSSIGPNASAGTVCAMAPAPSNPAIVYVAGDGGIFTSSDRGDTWTKLPDDRRNAISLAVDPLDPSTVWMGTDGDSSFPPPGLRKSIDGGRSWIPVRSGPINTGVYSIAIDSRSPSTVYAGTAVGLFKTADGGETWSGLNNGIPTFTDINRVVISASSPSIIYAGSAFRHGGLFKSTDAGASWRTMNGSLTDLDVRNLAVDPTDPNVVFRASLSEFGRVAKTTNGGATWQTLDSPLVISALTLDPSSPQDVYIGVGSLSNGGVWKSTDGGGSWRPARDGLTSPVVCALSFTADTQTLFAGTQATGPGYSGVFKSVDRGNSWTHPSFRFGDPFFTALEIDPSNPSTLYAGGMESFKTVDGGQTWEPLDIRADAFAIDPRDSSTIYAGAIGVRKSIDGGASWTEAALSNLAIADLAIDPTEPTILYAAIASNGQGVYRSVDAGQTWTQLFRFPGGDFGSTAAVALHPGDPGTIYAATSRGLYRTSDGGATWSLVGGGLPSSNTVLVEIDPHAPGTVYAAILTPSGRRLYKSVDAGVSWAPVPHDFGDEAVLALAIDPFDSQVLYVGTNTEGVFRSTDGGQTFQPFGGNLRGTFTPAIVIDPLSPSAVYAAYGGIYKATVADSGPCIADSITLCLNSGRFRVQVGWRTSDGTIGRGIAVPITSDTGAFWFFSDNNIELVVKVVDGRPVNGHYWVFSGALSNVAYEITVIDTVANGVKTYVNPQGSLTSRVDTLAFAAAGAAAPVTHETPFPTDSGCTPDGMTACLNDGRFRVEVAWRVPAQGTQGRGTALPLTSDTAAFWFFSSNNVELVLKVVDGRAFNGKFWVFFGALSDVEYTITVTDTVGGTVRTYFNPSGSLASFADTSAF